MCFIIIINYVIGLSWLPCFLQFQGRIKWVDEVSVCLVNNSVSTKGPLKRSWLTAEQYYRYLQPERGGGGTEKGSLPLSAGKGSLFPDALVGL